MAGQDRARIDRMNARMNKLLSVSRTVSVAALVVSAGGASLFVQMGDWLGLAMAALGALVMLIGVAAFATWFMVR